MPQGAPWERYGGQAQPAPQPPTIGYIPGVPEQPSALELRRDARADAAAARQAEASERAAAAAERSALTQGRMVANDQRRVEREVTGDQAALRKEFDTRADVKRFGDVRAAREQIRALATNSANATAQDDLALIFSFMRALDPGSVVREGEFATAQNAAGVPEQIRNQFNRLVSGERLSPQQRREFGQTADRLYKAERETYNAQATRYRQLAEAQGINPDFVARRYVEDQPARGSVSAPVANDATPVPTASRGLGEVEFGGQGGTPGGSAEYQREIEQGIQSGAIKTPEQAAEVARRYGFAPAAREQYQEMFDALAKGARFGGALPAEYQSVIDQRGRLEREGRGDAILDPAIRGAADTLTLGFADELGGIGTAIATGGNVSENIALQRGVDQFDEQRNFLPRLAGQIGAGFALPTGGANTIGEIARVGAGYGAGYGFGSADGSLTDRLIGAAGGGVVGGALGAAGGSLAQRLAARGGGGGNPAGREVYQSALDAGIVDDTGRALVLPADVGGSMSRRFTAGAAQSPFAAGPVTRAAERAQGRAGERLAEIAAAEGTPVRQEVFGEVGQAAAQGYIDRTGAAATRAYGRARDLAGDGRLQGTRAIANIDQQLQELSATANTDAPLIAGLQRLRADLAEAPLNNVVGRPPRAGVAPAFIGKDGKVYIGESSGNHYTAITPELQKIGVSEIGFADSNGRFLNRQQALRYVNENGENIRPSGNMGDELDALDYREQSRINSSPSSPKPKDISIDAIRRLRTSTRAEAVAEGLRGTDYNRRAGMVLDDLSEDIASQLSPEAAAAFREADRAYAERLATIDDVMEEVVGPRGDRSAEAVANRLIGLSRGDSARLSRFLNAVEPEEAGIIRGSLIQEMGRATSNQQTAAGDAFSLQTFLTNWDKMPMRTRDTLFRGEHRQAIEALARYAQGARESRAYANTSNTGGAMSAAAMARAGASGMAAFGTAGGTAVLENLTGRLLGSRRFAQWLARAPRDPAQNAAWARRLGVIATREPALAPDIAPLQAALSQAPNRAAAEDK